MCTVRWNSRELDFIYFCNIFCLRGFIFKQIVNNSKLKCKSLTVSLLFLYFKHNTLHICESLFIFWYLRSSGVPTFHFLMFCFVLFWPSIIFIYFIWYYIILYYIIYKSCLFTWWSCWVMLWLIISLISIQYKLTSHLKMLYIEWYSQTQP